MVGGIAGGAHEQTSPFARALGDSSNHPTWSRESPAALTSERPLWLARSAIRRAIPFARALGDSSSHPTWSAEPPTTPAGGGRLRSRARRFVEPSDMVG